MSAAGAKCDAGDVPSCKQAAELAMFGWGASFVATKVEVWARKACDAKDGRACFLAGAASSRTSRRGTDALFETACSLGDPDGCLRFAMTAKGSKLPDAAAKKLFGGKTAAELVDAACEAQRGDACLSKIARLSKGGAPVWKAICKLQEGCAASGGGCMDYALFTGGFDLPGKAEDLAPASDKCDFLHASARAGARALAGCKSGEHLCFRAAFKDVPRAEALRLLRDECVVQREARACVRLAGKLAVRPGEPDRFAIERARLVAEWRGQAWRSDLEKDGSMATPIDPDDLPIQKWDPRPALRASQDPVDAIWARVADVADVMSWVDACERNVGDGMTGDLGFVNCKSAIPALQSVDSTHAEDLRKRACKTTRSTDELCKSVK